MCPNCNEIIEMKIVSPTKWEFVPGHPFLITQENFYMDEKFSDYTKSIFIAYSNNEVSYKDLKSFIDYGFCKDIPVITICPKCHTRLESLQLCYHGTIYQEYYKLLECYFLEEFKKTYKADASFLYDNKNEIPYLTNIFLKKTNNDVTSLHRLLSIQRDIPNEKGGGGEELLVGRIHDIALALFGSFLYQFFLQDMTEKLKENIKVKIKEKFSQLKDKNYKQNILAQLKNYMQNEHVEWNEENAANLVSQEIEDLIKKYIESIY